MMHVISLGAGVQSTTMALMAAHGAIQPMPDCAIFADTGWEPQSVYDHLAWLMSGVLPFPVYQVSGGNLKNALLNPKGNIRSVPFHIRREDGEHAIGMRQCTKAYKIEPVRRKIRELLGEPRPKRGAVTMWLGISTDEAFRMKPSQVQFIRHRWPLVEARMNRNDCKRWLEKRNWTAPKSACLGCPYSSDAQWRRLRDESPEEWADTVRMDAAIRKLPRLKGQQFMHRSMVPLDQVDLTTAEDRGQLNLFLNECEGMCGV